MNRVYACIDLKSFYASVECVERNLNPLTTNLVVADASRTTKTICLAVSPSLKAYGIGGRARLFEVVKAVKDINLKRRRMAYHNTFVGKSSDSEELRRNGNLELDYITAVPRMQYYINYSTKIYNVYLKYISKEDIYVYSIDEVFLDITEYLNYYKLSAKELVTKMIQDVFETTGITATGGIGSNMYLAKVAMDIEAKHTEPNEYGVRIAELDEISYRKALWNHQPLTSFWRVGKGIARKLEANGMHTMGDVARMSLDNEELLYKLFGINAEFLIDHAWGYEPVTMQQVKNYKPSSNSMSSGQVLHEPYTNKKGKIVVREMADELALSLVDKGLTTNQLGLAVGYDIENLTNDDIASLYDGEIIQDYFGRFVPKPANSSIHLKGHTNSNKQISEAVIELYEKITNPRLLIRRFNITAINLISEEEAQKEINYEQLDLFSTYKENDTSMSKETAKEENDLQHAILNIKAKYGKNSIVKGMDLEEGATAMDRNKQIGGHKA